MVQIVMMIPTSEVLSPPPFTSIPLLTSSGFVLGECQIAGYERLILVETVEWEASVTAALGADGRRSVHSPKLSTIKIHRRVDLATSNITQAAMSAAIGQFPWEIYFLKAVNQGAIADLLQDTSESLGNPMLAISGHMQTKFLTVKLHDPLISNYTFDAGDNDSTEELEVSATAIEWIYHQVDQYQTIVGQKSMMFDLQAGSFT